jgi:hypothetical protein
MFWERSVLAVGPESPIHCRTDQGQSDLTEAVCFRPKESNNRVTQITLLHLVKIAHLEKRAQIECQIAAYVTVLADLKAVVPINFDTLVLDCLGHGEVKELCLLAAGICLCPASTRVRVRNAFLSLASPISSLVPRRMPERE